MDSDATPIALVLLGHAAGVGIRGTLDRKSPGGSSVFGLVGVLLSSFVLTIALPELDSLAALLILASFGASLGLAIPSGHLAMAVLGGALGVALSPLGALVGVGPGGARWIGLVAIAIAVALPREDATPEARHDEAASSRVLDVVGLAGGGLLGLYGLLAYRALGPYTGASTYAHAVFGCISLGSVALGLAVARTRTAMRVVEAVAAVAIAAGLVVLYPELEWIVPGAVRRLGGLASWPRALVLVTGETLLFVLPVAALLTASIARATGDARSLATGVALALLFGTPLVSTVAERTLGHAPFEERYGPLLFLAENGTTATLVTDDPEQGRMLRTSDGHLLGGVGTEPDDRVTAQLPMLLHPGPVRILQLGFGVGNGASSVLAHPVERLDVVEPLGRPGETASFFDWSNLDVMSDERLVLHEADPWRFLASTNERWDVIRLSASHLEFADGLEIPTVERLRAARARLAPGGVVSLKLNVGRLGDDQVRRVLATMIEVFPTVSVWDGPLGFTWVTLGSDEPLPLSSARIEELRADPDVDAEIGSLGLDQVATVQSQLVLDGDVLAERVGGASPLRASDIDVPAKLARDPITFFGLGAAAADTPLGDLTGDGTQENVGLARLFERLQRSKSWKHGR